MNKKSVQYAQKMVPHNCQHLFKRINNEKESIIMAVHLGGGTKCTLVTGYRWMARCITRPASVVLSATARCVWAATPHWNRNTTANPISHR